MQHVIRLIVLWLLAMPAGAQQKQTAVLTLKIVSQSRQPLAGATVELLQQATEQRVKMAGTDSTGSVEFRGLQAGTYGCRISRVGFLAHRTPAIAVAEGAHLTLPAIELQAAQQTLAGVTVSAGKLFVEQAPGKTTINLDAAVTQIGTTVLEALEKLPGVTVDKDGNVSLKGRSGVLVLLDGKPTYLNGPELATLLAGMSAAQISQVELMDQPPARYDAAGNAGIINIKTKKNRQKGFNGTASTAYSQGMYAKNNNSLQLNYRSGKWNFYTNYSLNQGRQFTRIYALRTYFGADETTLTSQLEQPSFIKSKGYTHTLRTGADYYLNAKTTLGININGLALERNSQGKNAAIWMDATGHTDSLIETQSRNGNRWRNGGANLSLRHAFTARRELAADIDLIGYRIRGNQFFENQLLTPTAYTEASRAHIPTSIRIASAKTDYTQQRNNWKWEGGWKMAHIKTDNLAAFEFRDGANWKPDLGKTNHFLYTERILAFYTAAETQRRQWTLQGGLRYELTGYDARQLGNALAKDSAFSRSYNSLFPSLLASFAADSNHRFSLSAGRRIDRPPFQNLNPFLFIINKYTYQQGNPFLRPQYTWNLEWSHVYKEQLTTSLSYSSTRDYLSQFFPISNEGIVLYSQGNLGHLQTFGLSAAVQVAPARWWNLSAQAVLQYKKLEGVVEKSYKASITQADFNCNNQFRFQKGWAGELSGVYSTRSQADIQELVDPAGQLSAGFSKTISQQKGTLKLAVRDLFYTQWMKGNTYFRQATEYFKLTRDTRVVTLSFAYRFGKAFKTSRRSQGASGDVLERVGNG